MKKIDFLRQFPEFSSLSDEDYNKSHSLEVNRECLPTDDVLQLIFAPDPVTGIPRSDLAVMMSRDSQSEIAQYIRDVLLSPVQSNPGIDDSDFALEATKSRGESLAVYAERLRDIVQRHNSK